MQALGRVVTEEIGSKLAVLEEQGRTGSKREQEPN